MTSAHPGAHHRGGSGSRSAAGPAPAAGRADDRGPAQPEELPLDEAVARVESEAEERPPAAGTIGNLLTAAAVVALGVAALVGSLGLDVGSADRPAAGTWPLLISVALVVLGVALGLLARRTTDAEQFSRAGLAVLVGLVTMVAFVALVGVIGFEIPAAVLTFVWLRFLGHESWRMSITTSVAVVAAFYLVFVVALSVPIPHLF